MLGGCVHTGSVCREGWEVEGASNPGLASSSLGVFSGVPAFLKERGHLFGGPDGMEGT